MRFLDLTSWQGILLTIFGVALVALIGVGIRVLMILTIQQRMNRQINARLRTLIAACKVLDGSFTGELSVDPTHLRELNRRAREEGAEAPGANGSDPVRRIRDAAEAALSDIILLGIEAQVRLASQAAADMLAGHPIHTAELVVSLHTSSARRSTSPPCRKMSPSRARAPPASRPAAAAARTAARAKAAGAVAGWPAQDLAAAWGWALPAQPMTPEAPNFRWLTPGTTFPHSSNLIDSLKM